MELLELLLPDITTRIHLAFKRVREVGYQTQMPVLRNTYSLFAIQSGHLRFAPDDINVGEGMFVLRAPGLSQSYAVLQPSRFIGVYFYAELPGGIDLVGLHEIPFVYQPHPSEFARMTSLLINIYDEYESKLYLHDLAIQGLLRLMLAILLRPFSLSRYGNQASDMPLVSRAVMWIIANHQTSITNDTVASELNCSVDYLLHKFKQEVGLTPRQFLINYRLQKACRLLRHSLLPIKTVAENVGFNDQLYFSRLFRRRYGTTPSEYRTITSSN